MAELQFFQTAMGRTFFEHTMPTLVREIQRLSMSVEKLTVEVAGLREEQKLLRSERRRELDTNGD